MKTFLQQAIGDIDHAFFGGSPRSRTERHALASATQRYEVIKSAWIETHPGAAPAEYTAAMMRIARQCGV